MKQHRQKRKVPEEKKRVAPQGKKAEWQQAVKDADRDYRRRHGIGFFNVLKKFLGKAVNLVMALIVAGRRGRGVLFRIPGLVEQLEVDRRQPKGGRSTPSTHSSAYGTLQNSPPSTSPMRRPVLGVPEKLPFGSGLRDT